MFKPSFRLMGVLTYAVKEKPYVREVKIQGASQVSREKIETALGVSPRTILDRAKVAEGVDKVRKLYNEQGYVNAAIDYAVSVEVEQSSGGHARHRRRQPAVDQEGRLRGQ